MVCEILNTRRGLVKLILRAYMSSQMKYLFLSTVIFRSLHNVSKRETPFLEAELYAVNSLLNLMDYPRNTYLLSA
jgi:hypothetical protein